MKVKDTKDVIATFSPFYAPDGTNTHININY